MSNPFDLIRNQQADNRSRHAQSHQQREDREQRRSQEWRYAGMDAEQGKAIVVNSSGGVAQASAVTNGWVKENQPVRLDQAGRSTQFDAMPRPKRILEATATQEEGSIKILSGFTDDDRALKFFVSTAKPGKFTFDPKPIFIVPEGNYADPLDDYGTAFITRTQINNTDKDWIIGISYIVQDPRTGSFSVPDVIEVTDNAVLSSAIGVVNTITPQKTLQIRTDTDRRVSSFFANVGYLKQLGFAYDLSYKGFGFWSGGRIYFVDGGDTGFGTGVRYTHFSWFQGVLTEGRFVLPQVINGDYRTLICNSQLKSAIASASPINIVRAGFDRALITKDSIKSLRLGESGFDFSPLSQNSRNFINFVGNEIYDCSPLRFVTDKTSLEIKIYRVSESGISLRSKKVFRAPIRLPANHTIYSASYHP